MGIRDLRLRCANDIRGATAVEFALVAMPFLGLLLASLQTGIIYMSQSALEVATEKSARLVLTGTVQGASQTQTQFLATVCAKLPVLLKCSNLMVDAQVYASFSGSTTSTPTITYDSKGNVTNTWSYNVGGPGDIVVLRVLYLMPVIAGPLFRLTNSNGKRLIMATAVFKNEPYQ